MDLLQCWRRPWTYGLAGARAPCSDSVEGGNSGGVDGAVCNPQPPVLLASSEPHDRLCINGLSAHIVIFPIDLPYRGRVLLDFSVHVRVGVHLGRGSRVEGDRGRRPAHVRHSPRRELRDLLARVRSLLRERREDGEKSNRIERQNK